MRKDFKVCVVNASNPTGIEGNDSYTDFREYNSWEDAKWRSWHSLACSQKTEFFAYKGDNFHRVYSYDGVILLVNQNSDLLIPFVRKLKLMKKKVLVGYHEGFGDFNLKVSNLNKDFLKCIKKVVAEADGYWNVIPSANSVYTSLLDKTSYACVHGIPYEEWNHGFKISENKRDGILIATRTFDQRLQRNTVAALAIADRVATVLKTHVTFISESPIEQLWTWKDFAFNNVKIIQGPFSYINWLKLIAQHRLVVHYDMSHTLGQIVCDAALVDVPAIGGNSENNILAGTNCNIHHLEEMIKDFWYNKQKIAPHLKRETSMKFISNKVKKIFQDVSLKQSFLSEGI